MSSEKLSTLTLDAELDVQVTLYDGMGTRVAREHGPLSVSIPHGLYRIQLERGGRIETTLIDFEGDSQLRPNAPALKTPTLTRGAATSHEYYTDHAVRLSTSSTVASPLGLAPHDGHLMVFVRRESIDIGPRTCPSEPLTLHDVNGRPLAALAGSAVERRDDVGYVAYSANAAHNIYRLRASASHREIAIPLPTGRAVHIFVADIGPVRIDDLRLFIPVARCPFDPDSQVTRAMEALLGALKLPHGKLSPSMKTMLSDVSCADLCLDIAAALVLLRDDGLDALLERLVTRIAHFEKEVPDVAIIEHVCRRRRCLPSPRLELSAPPLFRESFLLAMNPKQCGDVRIHEHSAIAQSARAGYHDSVWWTWSNRVWDARWVQPTVDALRTHHKTLSLNSIATTIAVPAIVVEATIADIDATIPAIDGAPLSLENVAISGYEVGELIGRGSQGVVHRARRSFDGRTVALKIIAFEGERTQRQAALGEITAMKRFDHSRLLGLVESGSLHDDSGMWLELELCRGSVMDRLAELDAPMSIDEACRIMHEALDGLAYLHQLDFVHRDVKPGNLLLREDGSVAVADFGLTRTAARVRNPSKARALGTARFAAPEQLRDASKADLRSDVWSAAATLYFMLTLELPRDEFADQSELDAARANPVIPIRERRPDLPTALADLIDTSLSLNPAQRPQDAAALRIALWNALGEQPARRRALVIGAPDQGLRGVETDASRIGALLRSRGFEVDLLLGAQTTSTSIGQGFDALVEATNEGDAAAIYYSGRGFCYRDKLLGPDVVMSVFTCEAEWVPLELSRLEKKTKNITVITDACLLKSKASALNVFSGSIVQISACGPDGTAFETITGPPGGFFTWALIEVLEAVGDLPFSWDAIARAVRARVVEQSRTQSPEFRGPLMRRPFSQLTGDDRGGQKVRREGDWYVIAGGRLTVTVAKDLLGLMPAGSLAYDPAMSLGELDVIEVLPATAKARLLTGTGELPDDVVAFPIVKHGLKRPVRVDVPAAFQDRADQKVSHAPTLRVARPGDRPIATLHADMPPRQSGARFFNPVSPSGFRIDDDVGTLFPDETLDSAIDKLGNLAAANGVRRLEGEHGVSLDEIEIKLGIVEDQKMKPLWGVPALGLGDRLCARLTNRSKRHLYFHVFNVGIGGTITQVEDRRGIAIDSGALRVIGGTHGYELTWPAPIPPVIPRADELLVVVTTSPLVLDKLETRSSRGATRGPVNTPLQDLFDQLYDGQPRALRDDMESFLIHRQPFLLVPLVGALAGMDFEVDETPVARAIGRAAPQNERVRHSETSNVEVFLHLHSPAMFSMRLDVVTCTLAPDGEPVMSTTRLPIEPVPRLFVGAVSGFLDISIFISPDANDAPDLSALLAHGALGDDVRCALRDKDPAHMQLALGAAAVAAHAAYDALRVALGTTRCLFHASYLDLERFGIGTHPVGDVYQADEYEFSIKILEVS